MSAPVDRSESDALKPFTVLWADRVPAEQLQCTHQVYSNEIWGMAYDPTADPPTSEQLNDSTKPDPEIYSDTTFPF